MKLYKRIYYNPIDLNVTMSYGDMGLSIVYIVDNYDKNILFWKIEEENYWYRASDFPPYIYKFDCDEDGCKTKFLRNISQAEINGLQLINYKDNKLTTETKESINKIKINSAIDLLEI